MEEMKSKQDNINEDDFPYFDDTVVFSDNLPQFLKERLALLKDAWRRKDIIGFMHYADCLEPLMKGSYYMRRIDKAELEKFFVMLGRDWWNRSPRVEEENARRLSSCLASFPKP